MIAQLVDSGFPESESLVAQQQLVENENRKPRQTPKAKGQTESESAP
jgi:hypothetical protein